MQGKELISKEINHLYRHEYGKIVAVLTKVFGINNIELAEDVVQEAMLDALKQWSFEGVPENPVGWIYKVAKNKAINIVNREKYKREYVSDIVHHLQSSWTAEPVINHIFTEKEIADDQLRMIFTCCHPSISADSQIALTLKTLCGFSIPEISRAFLTTEENINKRLVRARKVIKTGYVNFEVPTGKDLDQRLSSVLEVLYLLFNEGYHTSSGDETIRYELCIEAIRLAEIVVSNPNIKKTTTTSALLALMYFNTARFSSRINELEHLVTLELQDRNNWDKDFIQNGLNYLSFATQQNYVSIYHILATISAHHCTAKDYESTDWKGILGLYDNLIQIDSSPIVKLNRAVVLAMTSTPQKALKEIDEIDDQSFFKSYLPYYTVKAELLSQNKEYKKAVNLLNSALNLSPNKTIKAEISEKIALLREK